MKGAKVSNKPAIYKAAVLAFLLFGAVLILARFIYSEMLNARLASLESEQQQLLTNAMVHFSIQVGDIRKLTRLLKESEGVNVALEKAPVDVAALTSKFVRFTRSSPLISQLRWLDAMGNEKVRVNVEQNQPVVVPPSMLQNKASRYYFQQGRKADAGKVYVSAIDLNREHGEIVVPFQPTVRATIRTGQQGTESDGLLVINVDLTSLFQRVAALAGAMPSDIELLSPEGYWLMHPDKDLLWGADLGEWQVNAGALYPSVWDKLQLNNLSVFVEDGRLWQFQRFPLNTIQESSEGTNSYLYFVVSSQSNVLEKLQFMPALLSLSLGGVLLLVGGVVIARLYRTDTDIIKLNDKLRKEKQELADAYQQLNRSLEQQKLLQDELVESKKLSSLGMMVAGVAHELNTPNGGALMAVTSFKEALHTLKEQVKKGLSKAELEHFLAYSDQGISLAERNLRNMSALILSFKRLALDRSDEESHEFSLLQLTEDLLLTMKPKVKKTRINLHTRISPSLRMYSYPGYLSQTLQNLIDNAINHGFSPGQTGNIWVDASIEQNEVVRITVSDDGNGIDANIRDRIFDPFVTSGRGQGHTGLGMHLVNQWVTKFLRGRIQLDAEPGKGTTWILTLAKTVNQQRQAS